MVAVLLHRFGFRVVVAEKQMPTNADHRRQAARPSAFQAALSVADVWRMEIVPRAFSLSRRWIAHVRRPVAHHLENVRHAP